MCKFTMICGHNNYREMERKCDSKYRTHRNNVQREHKHEQWQQVMPS